MLECVELMNKIATAAATLVSRDSLTAKLADQMFSPCYRSDSTTSFSVRQTFALGDWVKYDTNADFTNPSLLSSCTSAIQSDSFLQDLLAVLPTIDRFNLKSKIEALCQSLENARVWTVFTLKPTSST